MKGDTMPEFSTMLDLQAQMMLLLAIGVFLAKKKLITDQGRACLTDLLLFIILPANIIQSFRIEFNAEIFRSTRDILILSILLQVLYGVVCAVCYNRYRYEGSVSTPDKRGVDEFFGYICQFQAHLYYPNFLNRYSSLLGDTATIRVTLEENIKYPMWGAGYALRPQYSADLIHEAAIDWLDRQSGDKPFFGFFTYTLPHAELVQPEDSLLNYYRERLGETGVFNGSYGGRYNPVTHTHAQFAAMIARLDNYVGEILKKLKEKGLDENTIVIFSSDNGPHEEGGADPGFFGRDGKLKGIKRSCHEGGIRIPFIVRWPGHVPVAVNDHQLAFYDILPTFCDLIGVNHIERYGENRKDYFDGLSFKPTLLGKDKHQKNHEFLYWEFCETDQIAVRQGDWKLFVEKGKCHLYNLVDDIHEDCDLAARYPDRVEDMKRIVFEQHVENPYFKVTMPQ